MASALWMTRTKREHGNALNLHVKSHVRHDTQTCVGFDAGPGSKESVRAVPFSSQKRSHRCI